jgi:transcription termination/antitermination protein NusG
VIDELENAIGQPPEAAVVPPATAPTEEAAPHTVSGAVSPAESAASEPPPSDPSEIGAETGAAPEIAEAAAEPPAQHEQETAPKGPSAPNGRVPAAIEPTEEEEIKKEWYILKVQSNREESIKEGLMRRVKAAGLDRYFGDCIVPTEMVSEFKGGKKRITKRKLYPGYLVVHMAINDDTWYLVRETTGIGDFTGSVGRPTPMLAQDVQKILAKSEEKTDEAPKLKIKFKKGDRVKINEGTFENFEGDVDTIDEGNGRVSVMINIFGRSTPVELEYWQIEAL